MWLLVPIVTSFIIGTQRNERDMNVTLEEYKATIAHLDEQLSLEAAKLEQNSQAKRDEYQVLIDASKSRKAILEAELVSTTSERDRLAADIGVADQQEVHANSQVSILRRKVQDIAEEIAVDINQEHDRLAAFGNNMTAVLAAIKKARWSSRQPPVGPLGMYVELEDSTKWAEVMRIVIGHQLRAFAITDARDFGPLKAILQRHQK